MSVWYQLASSDTMFFDNLIWKLGGILRKDKESTYKFLSEVRLSSTQDEFNKTCRLFGLEDFQIEMSD